MKRLTYIDHLGWYVTGEGGERLRGPHIDRLAAYEDTGLEPEEIEAVLDKYGRGFTAKTAFMEELYAYRAIGTPDEFLAALRRTAEDDKAREEGRLVVFPFQEGEPRYTIEKREPCREESGDVCECLYPENDDCVECRISHGTPYVQEYTSDSLRIAKRSIEQYYDAIGKTVFLTRQEAEATLQDESKDYPCRGHNCYDRGNFHVSCSDCPLYGTQEAALGGGEGD